MTRFSAFPKSQCLPHALAALAAMAMLVAGVCMPVPAFAQIFSRVGGPAETQAVVPASAQPAAKPAKPDEKDLPATIQAEQMSGRPDREITLERDVEITRGDTTITADKAIYSIVDDEVDATGHICMRRLADRYTGDELQLRMDAGQGYVLHPTYWLLRNHAQGAGERIDFETEDRLTVTQGTYSTCEGPDPDWYLKADTLTLDSGRDVGTTSRTIIYFKNFPILGAPGMSFPMSDARKSGVLPPSFTTTNKGGLEVTVPYYFNIAPNRDLTLYPNIITRRGLQLGADARYLGETYSGQLRTEFLLNDHQTGTNRYALASTHAQNLAPRLSMGWNINAASDNDYPSDFSRTITTSSQRLLPRDMNLTYADEYWNTALRVSTFQVLQDVAAPIVKPYGRLPQVSFQAGRQDVGGFDWTVDSELTRFWHPDFVRGDRFVLNPKIAYPMLHPGYFVTPKLSFDLTRYHLDNPEPGSPTDFSRAVPTFSIDSGLVFERPARLYGQDVTQTLEPRLFYVRTPYRDQSLYPTFDTAEADLSFAQLFSENRFLGHDRISDANQLTAAMVSRFVDQSGAELVRMALGQRFYFSPQRVNLGAANNDSRSDLLISAEGKITSSLSAEGNIQYSENTHELNRANLGMRWQPGPKRVLNLQYRRDLFNNLKQIDTSAQWPIASRWYAVGRVNYSLPDQKVVEGLLGMEYKASCWVFRVVGQRIPTAAQKATSAIFFQLELNGLTRLGSNPLDALRTSVPGYQLINQP